MIKTINLSPIEGLYEAPSMKVVEIAAEGVLCNSLTDGGQGGFEDLVPGDDIF